MRSRAKIFNIISIALYILALPLPACRASVNLNGYGGGENEFAGWACLTFGFAAPHIWFANPILWAVWFYYGRPYGVWLASLALLGGVVFLGLGASTGNPMPYVGGLVWCLSLAFGLAAAIAARGSAPPASP